jgi:hypothetical protein
VNTAVVAGSIVVLGVAFLPFLAAARSSLRSIGTVHPSIPFMFANAIYSLYTLFVSESVAPWAWRFSIPAALAVLASLAMVARWTPRPSRRFLIYSAGLIAVLALTGTLTMNRLLELSPWILLPIGIVVETEKPQWVNFALAAALLVIGGIGWYGIYSRRFYSSPRFNERWEEVANGAAGKIRTDATVIADDPAFLLYLTYTLHIPNENGPWKYEGSVTEFVHHPQIYSPADWLASQPAASRTMLLVRAGNEPGIDLPMDDVARQLDKACGSISSRLMVRDEGQAWKKRYLGRLNEPLWSIEVREYDCGAANSK